VKLVSNRTTWVLGIIVVLLVVLPLAYVKGKFEGSDDQGSAAIAASHPGFKPWAHPIWEPPSPEIESLVFALPAAIGAGVCGDVLGRAHGAARGREARDAADALPAKDDASRSSAAR
jgi:cobalt/nickel transport protein